MRKIEKIRFYGSGELVRDVGIVYFYKILQEIEEKKKIHLQIDLSNNYLEFNKVDPLIICEHLVEVKLKGDNFPFMRNSFKYGGNSGDKENIKKNLTKLLEIIFAINLEVEQKQKEILEELEPIKCLCSICHFNLTTEFDITHGDKKRPRKLSRLDYLFRSSEENTFNNYGKSLDQVCFECEFLNLIFLLYIKYKEIRLLVYLDNLKNLDFFNHKILLNRSINEKTLIKKLTYLKSENIRLYEHGTDKDSRMPFIKLNSILHYEKLMTDLKLIDLIDSFNFPDELYKKKDLSKMYIKHNNLRALQNLILANIVVNELSDTIKNIGSYNKIIRIIGELRGEEKRVGFGKQFREAGTKLGKQIAEENPKKNIAFKIIQLLKSDNRTDLMEYLFHILVVNSIPIPQGMASTITNVDNELGLHRNIGLFLEGFLSNRNSDIDQGQMNSEEEIKNEQ